MNKKHILLSASILICLILCFIIYSVFFAEQIDTTEDNMLIHDLQDGSYIFAPCADITEYENIKTITEEPIVTYIPEEQIASADNVKDIPYYYLQGSDIPGENVIPMDSYVSFEFARFGKDMVIAENAEYAVESNETLTIIVKLADWVSESNDVEIGLCNLEEEICYSYPLIWGYDSIAYPFNDLPAGNYRIYAYNKSENPLTTGIIRFYITLE